MLPLAIRPLSSNIPVKVFVRTDLPEPDSPTSAMTSPSTRSKDTLRMAVKTRSRTSNSTTISRADKITFLSFVISTPPIYVYVDRWHLQGFVQRYRMTRIPRLRLSMESRKDTHWLLRFVSSLKSDDLNLEL